MPYDFDIQRPLEFTFEDKDKYKITFPIEINSFLPAFEWDTERHAGNRMYVIDAKLVPSTDTKTNPSIQGFKIDESDV